ncbi:unnamed protein product [Effrenium voratum]|nr:unnamed protein product [Effrenium voratum]
MDSELGLKEDVSWSSKEYQQYEQEFKIYAQENLRNRMADEDFSIEQHEDPTVLPAKLQELLSMWQRARHVVIFTGAGISTSAGLPDYRGPHGVWTKKLKGEIVSDLELDPLALQPSTAHVAIARLWRKGFLQFVATTNVDGLHKKAGVAAESLAELHGNSFLEECETCLQRFERGFAVRTARGLFDHRTGRLCDCGGPLRDIIVNFGNTCDHVPSMEAAHDATWVQCLKADLVVVLGSSLSVPTACDLPEECLCSRDGKPASQGHPTPLRLFGGRWANGDRQPAADAERPLGRPKDLCPL